MGDRDNVIYLDVERWRRRGQKPSPRVFAAIAGVNVTPNLPGLIAPCSEMVHSFAEKGGRCQCGERTWEDSG